LLDQFIDELNPTLIKILQATGRFIKSGDHVSEASALFNVETMSNGIANVKRQFEENNLNIAAPVWSAMRDLLAKGDQKMGVGSLVKTVLLKRDKDEL
jgi:hypothetical protein